MPLSHARSRLIQVLVRIAERTRSLPEDQARDLFQRLSDLEPDELVEEAQSIKDTLRAPDLHKAMEDGPAHRLIEEQRRRTESRRIAWAFIGKSPYATYLRNEGWIDRLEEATLQSDVPTYMLEAVRISLEEGGALASRSTYLQPSEVSRTKNKLQKTFINLLHPI